MLGWKNEDFNSFWKHYDLAQHWIKITDYARKTALNDFEWKQAENEVYLMLNLPRRPTNNSAVVSSLAEDIEMEVEESVEVEYMENIEEEVIGKMTPEMIAFYQQTFEHREKRDKLRKIEEEEKRITNQSGESSNWLDKAEDEYVLADEGINGVQRQTVDAPTTQKEHLEYKEKMRAMYGKSAEKIIAMELSMNFKFNHHMAKYNPALWPNIPLRF